MSAYDRAGKPVVRVPHVVPALLAGAGEDRRERPLAAHEVHLHLEPAAPAESSPIVGAGVG